MNQLFNQYRYVTESSFRAGYNAYHLGEPYQSDKPQAWREGWEAAKDDEAREG